MQVESIMINAAGLAAGQVMQGNSLSGIRQAQAEDSDRFGPECRVTISREGRSLSRQQAAQAETESGSTRSVREERKLLRQQEAAELDKEIRDGYREKLNEIDKQITEYNTSYNGKMEMRKVIYDAELMEKTLDEERELREAMQSQKQFQTEEGQRRAREAQQLAMQAAQYKEEVDENNRDLLTLLKTMEEAEKAENEQENGEAGDDGSSIDASGAGNSVSDVLRGSATQFMTSSVNREMGVEELLGAIEDSGHWFLDTADSITRNVLRESANIRAAFDDEAFSNKDLAEMMESFQEGMALNYDNVKNFRAFGLQVLRDVSDLKIQHIADDPLNGMQQTKESMMLSAVDAALGEARQGSLDKESRELAEEVQKLIDERNDVDRIPQEREDNLEEQAEEEGEEEQVGHRQGN
ncbi:MAG: hypothetical protein NC123_04710 [Butyrivibrio sp.]|nr:hypothetical protein [Acetatifactor muris]MCM1558829.1 hypothetical protein [Butyrivibrio sp.]